MDPPAAVGPPVLQVKHCEARQGHRTAREDHYIDVGRVGFGNIQQPGRDWGSNQVSESNASVEQTCHGSKAVETIDVSNDGGDDTEVTSAGESVNDGEDCEDGDGRGDGPDAENAEAADEGADEEHVDPAHAVGHEAEGKATQEGSTVHDSNQEGSCLGSLVVEYSECYLK